MGRTSNREVRRRQLVLAFARVLASHGYAGATIAAVAAEAGLSPGLVHHHFKDKDELLDELLSELVRGFRERIHQLGEEGPTDAVDVYTDAALRLDERADTVAARCWVGLFAEAVRNPDLFRRVRRLLDTEIAVLERRSNSSLSAADAGATLAFVLGALVVGAFAPQKTAGFAAPAARRLTAALRRDAAASRAS